MLQQYRHGVTQADCCADFQPAIRLRDTLQLGYPTEINQTAQIAMLLGDPQTDIGRSGQQARLG